MIYGSSTAILTPAQAADAQTLDATRGLYVDGAAISRTLRSPGVKWLRGVINTLGNVWYILKPNGDLLEWNGGAGAFGNLLGNFGTAGYLHPALIDNAALATLTPTPAAQALDESLGLYVDRKGFYENNFSTAVKWLRGTNNSFGNPWYFIRPNGDFVAWDGTPQGGTLVGNFGTTAFLVPELLYRAFILPVNGGTLSPTTTVGLDFSPVTNQLRIVTDNGQNIRASLSTGQRGYLDTPLAYTGVAAVPHIVAASYTNNIPSPGSTTLYAIDTNRNSLEILNPENNGTLTEVAVGSLGVTTAEGVAGFDIVGAGNVAFAVLRVNNRSRLYTINLITGAAAEVNGNGDLGTLDLVFGLAVLS